jgi:filamentous hemagglutinin
VGDGGKLVSDQVKCPGCLRSTDGTRIYRPPTVKAPSEYNPTGVQANFVQQDKTGKIIDNGHLVIEK